MDGREIVDTRFRIIGGCILPPLNKNREFPCLTEYGAFESDRGVQKPDAAETV